MYMTHHALLVQERARSEFHSLHLMSTMPLQVDVFAHRLHVQNFELKDDPNSKQNGVC